MLIYESILDNIDAGRVDIRSASGKSADDTDYTFDQEYAWTFASFNPDVPRTIYNNIYRKVIYLLESYDVSYSIGLFNGRDYDRLPDSVKTTGRLDVMSHALVIMYTPVNRKSVKLPLLMAATLYRGIKDCPYISGDDDDDHYSLWQLQMGEYRLLDDDDFILECCSDILNGYNTQVGLVNNVFSNTVVDLSGEEFKKELIRINRSRTPRPRKINEGILDQMDATDAGTSARQLAGDGFRKMIAEQVKYMIKNQAKPDIDLQKYVSVWTAEVAFDLRTAVERFVTLYGPRCSLNWIDTSQIIDFSNLFHNGNAKKFNGDISLWDTSRAVYMNSMFEDSEFNGDISRWDVRNVKEFFKMFRNSKFNGNISSWCVDSALIMGQMFANSEFDGDISGWRPAGCWNFGKMFYNSPFSGDVSGWPAPQPVSQFNREVNVRDMFLCSHVQKDGRPEWSYGDTYYPEY